MSIGRIQTVIRTPTTRTPLLADLGGSDVGRPTSVSAGEEADLDAIRIVQPGQHRIAAVTDDQTTVQLSGAVRNSTQACMSPQVTDGLLHVMDLGNDGTAGRVR